MPERYTRVFTLNGQLYCAGAPVIVEAGALLKDNQTRKIIAQVKFKNISSKTIIALTARIHAKSVSGTDVAGVDRFQYLDLNVQRDAEFGAKTPIVLPDAVTRAFSCECLSALFSDGTAWECAENAQWELLPEPVLLKNEIGAGLAAQYQRDTGSKAEYKVADHKDLWYCGCGAVNHADERVCHHCRMKKEHLLTALSINVLRANRKTYEAALAEAERARSARTRTVAILATTAVAAVITLILVITQVIVPSNRYKVATQLLGKGEFIAAEEAFIELEDYKDAETMVLECRYQNALHLLKRGEYDLAYAALRELGAYSDAAEQILAGKHQQLIGYLEAQDYKNAALLADELKEAITTQDYLLQLIRRAADAEDYDTAFQLTDLLSENTDRKAAAREYLYSKAVAYYDQKDFDKANPIFTYLGEYKDSPDRIHFHQYVSKVLQDAACEVAGKLENSCSCGSVTETEIPALAHVFSGATCSAPKKCVNCGKTEGAPLPHTFTDATCTSTKKCSVCHTTEGAPLGHAMDDLLCTRCKKIFITLADLQGTWCVYVINTGELRDTITISGSAGTIYDHYWNRTTIGTVEILYNDVWIRYGEGSAYQTYGIVKCSAGYLSNGVFEWVKQ